MADIQIEKFHVKHLSSAKVKLFVSTEYCVLDR